MSTRTAAIRGRRAGFSIVELLMAVTISAMLLAATLQALDASWRGYKATTESASTHVVSRIVMHRTLAMIRTGNSFAPYPEDFFDVSQNPVLSDWIEFRQQGAGGDEITRLELRETDEENVFDLWYVLLDGSQSPAVVSEQRPLLAGVRELLFTLEYEPGPRLRRATVDITIQPDDSEDGTMAIGAGAPTIRLVASSVPRTN